MTAWTLFTLDRPRARPDSRRQSNLRMVQILQREFCKFGSRCFRDWILKTTCFQRSDMFTKRIRYQLLGDSKLWHKSCNFLGLHATQWRFPVRASRVSYSITWAVLYSRAVVLARSKGYAQPTVQDRRLGWEFECVARYDSIGVSRRPGRSKE